MDRITKEQRHLLKPHAEHFQTMATHIRNATIEELEKLSNAARACTETNCGWDEYRVSQYLIREIDYEIGWRNRRDATPHPDPAADIDAGSEVDER